MMILSSAINIRCMNRSILMKISTGYIACLICLHPLPAQQSPLWGHLAGGKYRTGFTVLNLVDSSRTIDNPKGPRLIQACVWYPALPAPGKHAMRYADYFLLSAQEKNLNPLSESSRMTTLDYYRKAFAKGGIPESSFTNWMRSPMTAVMNAPDAEGVFPVILIAQGSFESAHHTAILAEILASRGFCAISTPAPTRFASSSKTDPAAMAKDQELDLLYSLERLSPHSHLRSDGAGVIGLGTGAAAAFLLALDDKRVSALVTLDGDMSSGRATRLNQKFPGFDPAALKTSLLYVYGDEDRQQKPDLGLIESLTEARCMILHIHRFPRLYFTSLGMASAVIPGFYKGSDPGLLEKCEAVMRYAFTFLDAAINKSPMAKDFMEEDPTAHGIRSAIVTIEEIRPNVLKSWLEQKK